MPAHAIVVPEFLTLLKMRTIFFTG